MITYKGYALKAPFTKVYWKRKNKQQICKQYISLDTETSHNHDEDNPACWLYQWSFAFNHALYYGRTPEQLIDHLKRIVKEYDLNDERRMIVFVHNLPYDFSYLSLFLYDAFGDPLKLLAHDTHKPFFIRYACGLDFRCTYKLSNDSLARWGKKLGVKHPKLEGAIDYNVIRYQDSPLYRDDWRYQWSDCITLDECIAAQMELYNDDIASLPYTSTGYPRRELFRAYNGCGRHNKKNKERQRFKDTRLDVDTYLACFEEFAGGITHGNRYYKGITQRGNIRHRDFVSMYPTEQHKLFPMSKFIKLTNEVKFRDLEQYSKQYAILCKVCFEDMRIKSKKITLPYLQTAHVMRHHTSGIRILDDNGRVIQFKGQSTMWLDYNELKLILKQYDYTYMLILESYCSEWGYLPKWLTSAIDQRFKGKSDKKKILQDAVIAGQDRPTILKLELDLMKDKNMLNGIYGVSATNPIRETFELHGNTWERKKPDITEIGEKLDKYYKSYKNFMRYQWGIYTTIIARLQLMEVYDIIGADNFIYADTDSMFYFSTPEIEAKLDAYNEKLRQRAMQSGAYITTDTGKIINYDAFLDEGEEIVEFRFLHSKCYAYVTSDSKLHCTIAGVKAYDRQTNTFREDELGSIDNLTDKFVFHKCGGTSATYISLDEVNDYEKNSTCGGCIISRVTKTLKSEEWSETEKAFMIHNI